MVITYGKLSLSYQITFFIGHMVDLTARERQIDRQTERHTDRQTDRERERNSETTVTMA